MTREVRNSPTGWVMDAITRHVTDLPRSAILNLKRKNGETLWLEASGQSVAQLRDGAAKY